MSQQDVARAAGVSRVTVSLVLAGKDQTSAVTRRRVLEAAERLRYRPNLLVQGMQTGRSYAVGILLPASMPFQSRIAHGIHDELVARNYVPIMLWTSSSPEGKATELEQIHRLVDRRVDGIIVWPADVSVPDVHFSEIWERDIPLVTVDRETTTQADHVGTDEELGGKLAAEHLLQLGHREVLHVTRRQVPGAPLARRREAFVRRLKEAGAVCRVIYGLGDDLLAPMREVLGQRPRPTAVFAGTDGLAMKVYRVAAELGLRVPEELSVLGYADYEFAREMTPGLTTVKQDPYQMGQVAGQVMLGRIEGPKRRGAPRKVYIRPELVVRGSTAEAGTGG